MADNFSNREMVDRMRRMVEEAIARGANLAAALPEGSARKMNDALAWATQMMQRTPEEAARDTTITSCAPSSTPWATGG